MNIIPPSTSRSSKCLFYSGFSSFFYLVRATCPAQPNNKWPRYHLK